VEASDEVLGPGKKYLPGLSRGERPTAFDDREAEYALDSEERVSDVTDSEMPCGCRQAGLSRELREEPQRLEADLRRQNAVKVWCQGLGKG